MKSFLIVLLRLFPVAFRDQFGGDMSEQLRADYARARTQGRARAFTFSTFTALDLVRSALAERLNPTWVSMETPNGRRTGIGERMSEWVKDVRLAVRALRRSPMFAVVTVLTLGLALGANAGIFSVVDAVLLDPLPYPASDRLVYIAASAPGSDLPEEFDVSAEFFVQYSEQADLLESVSVYNSFTNTLRTEDRVERVRMSMPTPGLFSTLGVAPIMGRLPVAADEDGVALISHSLWVNWFGSDPDVIGRSYDIGGRNRTVVGVMGPDFWFPDSETVLWIPTGIRAEDIVPGRFGDPLVGRLSEGVSHEALASQLGRLAQRLPERFGGSANYARLIEQHRPVVRSLEAELLGATAGSLWVLLGSVAIVLLIACANVGNLFLVRSEHRQRDLAVRRAIGAARSQLIRLQMAEAVVVAGLAGVLAVFLARATVPLLLSAAPADIPRLADVGVTVPTLLFTLATSIVSALLCGLWPAVRSSSPKLARLRDGGRGTTRRHHFGRDAMVVAQTALALVLLIGSGLLVRSMLELQRVDPGYDTDDIFTFQIAPEAAHLNDGPSFARFHMDFMDRIAALPGVTSVGLVENVPLNEGVRSTRFLTEATAGDAEGGPLVGYTWAAGEYFHTMGIATIRGRTFTGADHSTNLGNVIISRSAADLLWPGEDPIGRRVQPVDTESWYTVVGLVEDVLQYGYRDEAQPLIYLPLVGPTPTSWFISSPAYVVKTGRAATIAPEIRALVRDVAPEAPMYRTFTMAGLASDSMVRLSFTMLMLVIASALALALGGIGLYAVLSYLVTERTQEIGVRIALGAEVGRVRRMVVAQGVRVVVFGVAIGVAAAFAATRLLGSLLFGVEAVDLTTFAGMSATMVLVGLLASYVPARRASSVDPIQSLSGG